jgi:hypothetical protein
LEVRLGLDLDVKAFFDTVPWVDAQGGGAPHGLKWVLLYVLLPENDAADGLWWKNHGNAGGGYHHDPNLFLHCSRFRCQGIPGLSFPGNMQTM